MAKQHTRRPKKTAICEVHIEHVDSGLSNLHGYEQAFVIFRMRGTVVSQAWLPVHNGSISPATLREKLPESAWPAWMVINSEIETEELLPSASVVVCTRDRTSDLANCLPGLQQLAAQGYDVIVVDSCPSTDQTAHLMASYPDIRYIHESRPGLDIARNRGLLAARGEIVAYTDDDAQISSGWLKALLRNFNDPMVAIATGITMPLELETEAQLWFEQTNGFGRGFIRKSFDVTTINPLGAGQVGAGVNMAIRRSAVEHIGLFDEALDGGTLSRSGGDQEYFYRALARGYRIVYDPAALVWHRHRREWKDLRQTFYVYGVGLYAWWTRAFLAEGEWSLLKLAARWFWQQHVRTLLRALLRRPGHVPVDLAFAELRGALAGPRSYLQARRVLREQMRAKSTATIQMAAQLKPAPVPAPVTTQVAAPPQEVL